MLASEGRKLALKTSCEKTICNWCASGKLRKATHRKKIIPLQIIVLPTVLLLIARFLPDKHTLLPLHTPGSGSCPLGERRCWQRA